MSAIGRSGLAVLALALCLAPASVAEAQKAISIGTSASRTGAYAAPGQERLRGYQLCVKETNDKGGVLGRKLELVFHDDGSDPAAATKVYERLVAQDRVDLVFGPFGSPLVDAVAEVTEKHRLPLLTLAATPSIFKKGRKFVFTMLPPAAVWFEGLLDLATRKGLRTVAVINSDNIFARAVAQGAGELARKKGLQLVLAEAYPEGTTDFSEILRRLGALNPDVLAAATYFEDAVAITRQMKERGVNPRVYGGTVGVDIPAFHETLGRSAEYVYGVTAWVPELVTLRAGGLIPVARQYPGAREFVESYRREFSGTDPSYHAAGGYGGCQVLLEAIRRAGSLDGAKIRDRILSLDVNTVFGAFKVDQDGLQLAHKQLLFQWQDGKKVIVWPEELAPGKPRFPTPPWNQRP